MTIEERADSYKDFAFQQFAAAFAAGVPDYVLADFARRIRLCTDARAFETIQWLYYHLLFVYHLKRDWDRSVLQVLSEVSLDLDRAAQRLGISTGRLEEIASAANGKIDRIIKEFDPARLLAMTGGTLP